MIPEPERVQQLAAAVDQDLARLHEVQADEDKVAAALVAADEDERTARDELARAEKATRETRELLASTASRRAALAREVEISQFMLDQARGRFGPFGQEGAEPHLLIADGIGRGAVGTLAFPAIRAARPVSGDNGAVVCGQPECGKELVQRGDLWIHTGTEAHNCNSEVGTETRADDPLRLQQLDQGEVREAVDRG